MNKFDALWSVFEPILKVHQQSLRNFGRPRKSDRPIFYGVMWLTRSGARWKDLPEEYGPYQTAHRRYQEWVGAGLIDRLYENTLALAVERGLVDTREGFIDATFAPAKKGGSHRADEKGKRQQNHGHLRRKRPAYRTVARKRQPT
jgi:transposase